MKVFISTIAFYNRPFEDLLKIAKNNKIHLEFGSALPFRENMVNIFQDYPFPKLAHNYFPPPETPFVLNLASANEDIRKRSILHCINGLRLTKENEATFFAAHAGFCHDPKPEELGNKFKIGNQIIDKVLHWELFKDSVKKVVEEAEKLGVDFLIENNVVSKFNINKFNQNPLFCADGEEMVRIVQEVSSSKFGILLDTGHLKVSGNTLGFSLMDAVNLISSSVKAIHHSDNNGEKDTNSPLGEDYWFLEFIDLFNHLPQIIEVKNQSLDNLNRQRALLVQNLKE